MVCEPSTAARSPYALHISGCRDKNQLSNKSTAAVALVHSGDGRRGEVVQLGRQLVQALSLYRPPPCALNRQCSCQCHPSRQPNETATVTP